MSYQCGWASISENGNAGWDGKAKAGNQTGRELRLGAWYSFGQNVVYRFKDRAKAIKYARVIKKLCKNKCIGYDQSQRTTLYTQLKKVDFDVDKLTVKCECDCSTLVAVGLLAIGIDVPYNWRTASIADSIMDTGEFEKLTESKYLKSGKYLMVGDIVNKPAHHVISVLVNGSGVKKEEEDEDLTKKEKFVKGLQKSLNKDYGCGLDVDYDYGPKTEKALSEHNIKRGSEYYTTKHLQYWLNDRGFKDQDNEELNLDGDFGDKTEYALKQAQKKLGVKADGEFGSGTCNKFMKLFD